MMMRVVYEAAMNPKGARVMMLIIMTIPVFPASGIRHMMTIVVGSVLQTDESVGNGRNWKS